MVRKQLKETRKIQLRRFKLRAKVQLYFYFFTYKAILNACYCVVVDALIVLMFSVFLGV